jgi:hypothetical protein
MVVKLSGTTVARADSGHSSALSPKAGMGAVVLSNAETPAGVDDIGQHLLNANAPLWQPPTEHKQVAVDAKVFDVYVERYQLASNFILTITREGTQFFVQATGQPKLEIFPESEHDYFLKGRGRSHQFRN